MVIFSTSKVIYKDSFLILCLAETSDLNSVQVQLKSHKDRFKTLKSQISEVHISLELQVGMSGVTSRRRRGVTNTVLCLC